MSTSTILGNLSQLPMNIGYGAGPDTTQNPIPTGPTPAPVLPSFVQPSFAPVPQASTSYPPQPNSDSTQPQNLTDLTRMCVLKECSPSSFLSYLIID